MKETGNSEDIPHLIIHDPAAIQHPLASKPDALTTNSAPSNWLSCPTWNLGLEPWSEPVDGKLLLDQLAGVFTRFVVLPKWAAEVLALWSLHTYAFHLRGITAYLGIESPQKRRGKDVLVDVLSALVDRPVVSSNISPSGFFRLIEDRRPTLLVDESDSLISCNDELHAILNSGFTRSTAFVIRVTNHPAQSLTVLGTTTDFHASSIPGSLPPVLSPGLDLFSTWCPKAMAVVGRLPESFAGRCIPIRMRRKTSRDRCDRLSNLVRYSNALQRKSARFVSDHSQEIANACPELPSEFKERSINMWEPLFALADLAGGPWTELARQAAVALQH